MLAWIAVIAIGLYLVLCALLFAFQRSLIYMPQPGGGAPSFELASGDARLRITARPLDGPDAVIYFGGNAESVDWSLPELQAAFPKSALYLMNYRGYGGSSGQPSEAALFADALALYDHVQAKHARIVVVGRSLGSGVATWLASQRPAVQRLVLVTPYDSIGRIAARQFAWVPVSLLLRDHFDSASRAPGIHVPTLVLAAEHDEVIPRASTEALLARFPAGVANFKVLPGTGHNSIGSHPGYGAALAAGR